MKLHLYDTPSAPAEVLRELYLVPLPNIPEIKEAFWGAVAAIAFMSRWQEIGDMSVLDTTQWLKRAIVESRKMQFHIGMVIPTLQETLDDDLLLADGSVVDQADYPQLAEKIGVQYLVGDTIVLPDLRGLFILSDGGGFAVGDTGGELMHTLTEAEIPSHNHSQNPHSHSEIIPAVTPSFAGEIPAGASLVVPTPSVTGSAIATNNPTGGGGSHENMPPYYVLRYAIVVR